MRFLEKKDKISDIFHTARHEKRTQRIFAKIIAHKVRLEERAHL